MKVKEIKSKRALTIIANNLERTIREAVGIFDGDYQVKRSDGEQWRKIVVTSKYYTISMSATTYVYDKVKSTIDKYMGNAYMVVDYTLEHDGEYTITKPCLCVCVHMFNH